MKLAVINKINHRHICFCSEMRGHQLDIAHVKFDIHVKLLLQWYSYKNHNIYFTYENSV